MAERIPQNFIDDLVSRTDIVELIDSYIHLKKSGSNYSACCPFHDEKTPSFTVSPTKQFYHCFGCGAHGTAIGFLMEYERLGFIDAIELLANRAGLTVPRNNKPTNTSQSPSTDYDLLEQSNRFFQRQLRLHEETAIKYLKQRRLSGETAKRFNIGFAPPGWNNLLETLGTSPQQQKTLIELGLVVKNDNDRLYDRFRNRIIFPIKDNRGRTIAFGGRVIDSNDNPKYLNSPESEAFHKGKELYGLWEARQSKHRLEMLLVVEGYMDVVMLSEQGIHYAVATLGTAATEHHIDRLFRNTSEIIFCFDGDQAGQKAALRAMQHALPAMKEGRQARFMFLPDGEDPDSLVQKLGAKEFEKLIGEALPLSSFLFHHLQEQVDMTSLDGRARLIELARPFFSSLPNGVYKHMLTNELARIAKIDSLSLQKNLAMKPVSPDAPPKNKPNTFKTNSAGPQSPMARAIMLILQQPSLANEIPFPDWLKKTNIPGALLLQSLIENILERPNLTTAGLLELWRSDESGPTLFKLAQKQIITPEQGLKEELVGALKRIKQTHMEQRAELLLQKGHDNLTPEERKELAEALTIPKAPKKLEI